MDTELIYVGDPMCSWCWGIAPELDAVRAGHPELAFRVVVGGLRPGEYAQAMTDEMAEFLGHHWEQVSERSGQPFDTAILGRRDWIYDTELACRAVVAMRMVDEPRAFDLFKRIQRAFYADGVDVTEPDVYAAFAADVRADVDKFSEVLEDDRSREATWHDFATAREWGVTGFPTVIARSGDQGHIGAQGYAPAAQIEAGLVSALDIEPNPLLCGPDNC